MRILLIILLTLLLVSEAKGEEEFSIKLSDIDYGITALKQRPITGSFIRKITTDVEIVETTDRIPFSPETKFGFEMSFHSTHGKSLQIVTMWMGPDGKRTDKNTTARSVRNGGKQKWSFRFDPDNKPGQWTLKVFLVGIDSSLNEILGSEDEPQYMKLYEKGFEMYEPEDS